MNKKLYDLKMQILREKGISDLLKKELAEQIFQIEQELAINYTRCCESDSEQLCKCEIKTLPNGNINYKMCKKCQIEEGLA